MRGRQNASKADVAELSPAGVVELVGSTAHGRRAGGVRVATSARAVRGLRSAGGGVRYRLTRRSAWVYAVRGGRVRAVGVASRALARSPQALRGAMGRLLAARASAAPRAFVPNAAQAGARGRITGRTLAGTGNPTLDAAMAFLCGLQVQGAAR